MIGLLAGLLLGPVGPPVPTVDRHQTATVRWDAETKACVPTVHGVDTGDIATDAGRDAFAAAIPDKGAELHLIGGAGVPYACLVSIVDALKHSGFYGRIAMLSQPPLPGAR